MQRDLLDSLRCPRPHDESWLVAVVHVASGSELIEAQLACPVCGAEYRVAHSVAHFSDDTVPEHDTWPADDQLLRLAALLGVVESLQPVALVGRYAASSAPLASYVASPQLLVNAAGGRRAVGASRIVVADKLPLGVDTLAAVAVDAANASVSMLESAVRALRLGGRLVAPADAPIPAGMRELARDETEWVAETITRASGLVELRRRAPESVR